MDYGPTKREIDRYIEDDTKDPGQKEGTMDDHQIECAQCGDWKDADGYNDILAPDGMMWTVCGDCAEMVRSEGISREGVDDFARALAE